MEVPRLIGRNSGEIIIFVSSKRRRLEARNFTVIYFSILLQRIKRPLLQNKRVGVGFSGPKSFRDFRKTGPSAVGEQQWADVARKRKRH